MLFKVVAVRQYSHGKQAHADPRVHVGKQGAGTKVREQHNVCAWMYAGKRAAQCVRMYAVDEQCRRKRSQRRGYVDASSNVDDGDEGH